MGLAAPLLLILWTLGSLALVLLVSAITPLYHVRYVFTYSPAVYIALGAGLAWLWTRQGAMPAASWRAAAVGAAAVWLAAAGVTLHAFWADPIYRADDHRAAVRALQAAWRPGDMVLVNAGYAYTALLTYWDGPVAVRARLTDELPTPRDDAALLAVTTGHVDGAPELGWADPRSDFYALPAATAQQKIDELFTRFPRVWHYRIYDTVNDAGGRIRALLAANGALFRDEVFSGEANMRLQGFVSEKQTGSTPGDTAVRVGPALNLRPGAMASEIEAGATLYGALWWEKDAPLESNIATSLRLVGLDGRTWAQPPDEQPVGPLYLAPAWPVGAPVRQPFALPVPPGAPPGQYAVELVVYDPATGQPLPMADSSWQAGATGGIVLGKVNVIRGAAAPLRPALARFGALALVEAGSPATTVTAEDVIPVELLWQAAEAPGEAFVVVVQLLDGAGGVTASLEEQPVTGRYPTQQWAAGELVRDRHALALPRSLASGEYRLVVGLYRAADGQRLNTRSGLCGRSDHYEIKRIVTRARSD